MERLNIGIDIDGTITEPYYWLDSINEHFNRNIKPEEVIEYSLERIFDLSIEELVKHYKLYGEQMHSEAIIREDASQCIKKMTQEHNIFYITARIKRMERVTKEWLQRHDLPVDDNIYLLGTHDKLAQAQELQCDYFIEDRLETATQLAEAGIHVLLIDCTYNKKIEDNHKITRVYNWQDICSIIMGEK